jgi:hypothetical protein
VYLLVSPSTSSEHPPHTQIPLSIAFRSAGVNSGSCLGPFGDAAVMDQLDLEWEVVGTIRHAPSA